MEKKEMRNKLSQVYPDFINDLKNISAIPSYYQQDDSRYPFGKPVNDVLLLTLDICEKLGYTTYYDLDGYYGYAEIGKGDEMIGVLGHLDVVPPGDLEKWDTNPFAPVIKDNKLYARGTQDDKGPTLASLYAVKALHDLGVNFNKRVRFIFGTDEETLWRGIAKYQEKEEMPSYGFTPDSKFPLIYAEKGLLQCKIVGKNDTSLNIVGGDAFNSVPSKIKYDGTGLNLVEKLDELGYEYSVDRGIVTVLGKSVHSQSANLGLNAIVRLCIALYELGINSKIINFINETIKEDAHATDIFGNLEDEHSGKLTFNIGKIDINGEKEELSIDIRIPVTIDKEEVVNKLKGIVSEFGLVYQEYDFLKSIYLPKESKIIATLMEAYQEVTGDLNSQPETSGGATYARSMDNCVAFGAVLKGRPKVEHQPNEYIDLEDMFVAMEIYATAIYKLLIN